MSRKSRSRSESHPPADREPRTRIAPQLLRRTLVFFLPVLALWWLITPFYNRFLIGGTETLVRLSEEPSVTRLAPKEVHYAVITRTDRPISDGALGSFRVTDIHFPLLLLWSLFLAVPGVAWTRRLEAVGWATLLLIFFHLFDAFLWVKFTYATQLGSWSAANYTTFQQNFWGLSKHVADLPVKFGLPLALWVAFFYRELTGRGGPKAATA